MQSPQRASAPALAALAALAIAATLPGLSRSGSAAAADELVRLVVVSRHGVRTPTIPESELDGWAASPWPAWREPLGTLTTRGRRLAGLMGAYDREWLAAEGLLPATGCPEPGALVVYADVIERTMDTARALAGGLAPGCGVPVLSRQPKKVDPLFHPVEAGVCRLDPAAARRAVLQRVHGKLDGFAASQADAFSALQSVLLCCGASVCESFGRPAGCELPDLPTGLAGGAPNAAPHLNGALSIGSDASEILLLEFAEGKPADQVGWGRAGATAIRRTLPLHDAAFDLTERTPYLARAAGSALLSQVAATLTGRVPVTAGADASEAAVSGAPVVFLVGHDTNIANLGGMLGATWELPGYPTNETPPAGALFFQLRRDGAGVESVLVEYVSQTLEQMRAEAPLSLASPPLRVPVAMPGCAEGAAGRCTLPEFARAVARAVEPACAGRPRVTPAGSPGSPAGATSETPSDTPERSSPRGRSRR